jgi:hypothetical protein
MNRLHVLDIYFKGLLKYVGNEYLPDCSTVVLQERAVLGLDWFGEAVPRTLEMDRLGSHQFHCSQARTVLGLDWFV